MGQGVRGVHEKANDSGGLWEAGETGVEWRVVGEGNRRRAGFRVWQRKVKDYGALNRVTEEGYVMEEEGIDVTREVWYL